TSPYFFFHNSGRGHMVVEGSLLRVEGGDEVADQTGEPADNFCGRPSQRPRGTEGRAFRGDDLQTASHFSRGSAIFGEEKPIVSRRNYEGSQLHESLHS